MGKKTDAHLSLTATDVAPSAERPGRLALFLNIPVDSVDGELSARYPHLLDFFLALALDFDRVDICLPVRRGSARRPDHLAVPLPVNVRILPLAYWDSAPALARRIHRVVPVALWVALRNMRQWDVVGAVAPSVVGNIFVGLGRLFRRPLFMMVRGEKQRTVKLMMGARAALPFVILLRIMELMFERWVRAGVPTFVAGEELWLRYQGGSARIADFYPAMSRSFPIRELPRRPPAIPPLHLVTVARLSPEKGLGDLLTAIAELDRVGLQTSTRIVGDGPERDALEAQARRHGILDHVTFRGFVPHGSELVALLDEADLFVLPSHSEGVPHSIVEAMCRGLGVVATPVGGIPGLLATGAGVLVPPGRPAALARVLRDLNGDPNAVRDMGAEALRVAQGYRPDVQRAELRRLLQTAYPTLSWGASPAPPEPVVRR
jgi:glycosyltransferase involved in cell wall biosynthesis